MSKNDILTEISLLYRIYNIGAYTDFKKKVNQYIQVSGITLKWKFQKAIKKIPANEIIKYHPHLDSKSIDKANFFVDILKNNPDSIRDVLFSKFESKEYSQSEENIARFVRHNLCILYIDYLLNKLKQLGNKNKKEHKLQKYFFVSSLNSVVIIGCVFLLISSFKSYKQYKIEIVSYNEQQEWLIENSPTVYITATGKKYHTAEHYNSSNRPVKLYYAVEKLGLDDCAVCKPIKYQKVYLEKPEYNGKHPVNLSIILVIAFFIINKYIIWPLVV